MDGKKLVGVRLTERGVSRIGAEDPVEADRVFFKIRASVTDYSLLYSLDGQEWVLLGEGSARALSPEDFVNKMCFTGVVIGLYASGNGKPASGAARFDWFEARNG